MRGLRRLERYKNVRLGCNDPTKNTHEGFSKPSSLRNPNCRAVVDAKAGRRVEGAKALATTMRRRKQKTVRRYMVQKRKRKSSDGGMRFAASLCSFSPHATLRLVPRGRNLLQFYKLEPAGCQVHVWCCDLSIFKLSSN